MEDILLSDERGSDLVKWCNNLDALGNIVSFLAWANDHDGDECFYRSGEHLGVIISDYATLIKETVGEIKGDINEAFEGDDGSKISKLERGAKRIKERDSGFPGVDLEQMGKLFKEFKPVFDRIINLNSNFINMKEEAVNKLHELRQKRALAGSDTEAKAHEKEDKKIIA